LIKGNNFQFMSVTRSITNMAPASHYSGTERLGTPIRPVARKASIAEPLDSQPIRPGSNLRIAGDEHIGMYQLCHRHVPNLSGTDPDCSTALDCNGYCGALCATVANVREERYVTKTVRKRPVKGLDVMATPENEGPAATPIQRMLCVPHPSEVVHLAPRLTGWLPGPPIAPFRGARLKVQNMQPNDVKAGSYIAAVSKKLSRTLPDVPAGRTSSPLAAMTLNASQPDAA
jgi:hypothetical protein